MRTPNQTIEQLKAECSWYETDPEAAEISDWYAAHAMNDCLDGIATCRRALEVSSKLRQMEADMQVGRDWNMASRTIIEQQGIQAPAGLPKLKRVVR